MQRLMRDGARLPHMDSRRAGRLSGAHARALARPDLSREGVGHRPRRRDPGARHRARGRGADPRPARTEGRAAKRGPPGRGLGAPVDAGPERERGPAVRARRVGGRAGGAAGGARQPEGGAARSSTSPAARGATEDAVQSAADVLRDAGDVVVIWGERVASGERGPNALDALLALAGALGVGDRPESGLIEVPACANGRGLREVGCVPTLGPGLQDAPAAGMTAAEIAASGEPGALLLVEHELPAERLDAASAVVAFAKFPSEALDRARRRGLPRRDLSGEGGHGHASGRAAPTPAPGARPRGRGAPGLAGPPRPLRAPRGGLRRAHRADGHGERGRGRPPLRRHLARRDRRPRRALAGARGRVGAPGRGALERAAAGAARPGARACAWPRRRTLWTGPEVEHSPSLRFLSTRARAPRSPWRTRASAGSRTARR